MKKGKYAAGVAVLGLAAGLLAPAASAAPPPNHQLADEVCKNGGWQDFGGYFKNQGQCMAYFNHTSFYGFG